MKRLKPLCLFPHAFTLVELLVVIAIIGIFIGMALPALQAAREAARRSTCMHNLMRIGVALSDYELANQSLPSGTTNPTGPIHNVAQGIQLGWLAHILPYIDERNTFKNLDLSAGAYAAENAPVRRIRIALFECPSYIGPSNPLISISNYAGCHNDVEAPIDANNNGVLYLNSHISARDVSDGVAHTIYVGEKGGGLQDLGWLSGTRATLRNTGSPLNRLNEFANSDEGSQVADSAKPNNKLAKTTSAKTQADLYVGGFGSYHPYGVNFLFGDGSVHFVKNDIGRSLLEQLGNRADGKLLKDGPTRGE
ncbi:MAG: DUF1559 family PulG-like putative transporter [Thermoguttaceae bacterium]